MSNKAMPAPKETKAPDGLGRIGAIVQYCGHDATFVADVITVADAVVIRANGPIKENLLTRPADPNATHHVSDFPVGGFWRPDLGVLVVPKDQVTLIRKK
jgi:hypothetical protein